MFSNIGSMYVGVAEFSKSKTVIFGNVIVGNFDKNGFS